MDSPLDESIEFEVQNYEAMIADNAKAMKANATWLVRGVALASLSPILGVVAYATINLFFPC